MSRDFSALLWVACFHLKVCACATSTVWVPVLNLVLMPQRLSMVNESVIHLSFGILLLIRPSKKNTCFSSPPASFLAPPLFFFYYFFMSNVFMSKNQQASLVRPWVGVRVCHLLLLLLLVKPIAAVYAPK